MAIALSHFEAFIGFRPLDEIAHHIEKYPEFASVLGAAGEKFVEIVKRHSLDVQANKGALKNVFSALQHTPQEGIDKAIGALAARIDSSNDSLDQLLLRLNGQFRNDVGTFCALMLNYVSLAPGEAIFLAGT